MDELLIRQAPHSPEAEQAVLGSMLIDADCVKDVMDKLQPEDFYLRQNLSLIHISEPTRRIPPSRMPSSA